MSKLADLQQKRATLVKDMRSFIDGIDNTKGLSDEQQARFDTMNADLDKIDAAIKREEQVAALEDGINQIEGNIRRPSPQPQGNNNPLASSDYVASYDQFVRSGLNADIRGALTIGTDTDGGFTVPEEWAKTLIHKLTDNVIMRQIATITPTGNDKNLPLVSDNGEAGWVDEAASYPESDVKFGNEKLEAHKLGRIIKLSEELLQDSMFDILGEIVRIFGLTFGIAEEKAFFTGDGNKKPKGIVVSADLGKAAASATAITYDEIVDLVYSVREVYRTGSIFTMKSKTAGMLRKLKSSDGVPLWQPSLQLGQPDSFLGYSVRTVEAMDDVATGKKPILFGNFREYRIADRGSIAMQRLDELFTKEGMVGFKMRKRVDGKLVIAEAVKSLQMA